VRPDDATGTLLNLVVGSSGQTIAQKMQVKVEPPLPAIDSLLKRADSAQATLADGIQSLPPGRTLMWPLGQAFNVIKTRVLRRTPSRSQPKGRLALCLLWT